MSKVQLERLRNRLETAAMEYHSLKYEYEQALCAYDAQRRRKSTRKERRA